MIIQVEAFKVLEIMEHYTNGKEDFNEIWKRFMMFHPKSSPLSTDKAYYSVYWEIENKELAYLAGMKVPEVETIIES